MARSKASASRRKVRSVALFVRMCQDDVAGGYFYGHGRRQEVDLAFIDTRAHVISEVRFDDVKIELGAPVADGYLRTTAPTAEG